MTVKVSFFQHAAWLAAVASFGWAMNVQAATQPEQLALSDLTNHPERWPDTVSLKIGYDFKGSHYSKGDTLQLVNFDGRKVALSSKSGKEINVNAGDCDLAEAANAAWSKLTPAQRAIDLPAIAADMSLWPPKAVMRTVHFRQDGTSIPAGTQCTLADVTREGVDLIARRAGLFQAPAQETDLFARARERAAMPHDQRPSRIAAAFKGLAVDAKGQPYTGSAFDDAKIYVLYCGAGWCPGCLEFSPRLVKFINENAAANPHMAAVMLSNDANTADMLAYMHSEKMPFPGIPQDAWGANFTLFSYTGQSIPQLVVVDRDGKVLANTFENHVYAGPDKTLDDLKNILSSGAAK